MNTLTWHEVICRDDIIGGDVVFREGIDVYRGPTAALIPNGKSLCIIQLVWAALAIAGDPRWEAVELPELHADLQLPPLNIGLSRVRFHTPSGGTGIITPKGGFVLKPTLVRGLEEPALALA